MDEQKLAEIEARAKAATEQATELDGKFGTFIHHYGQDIPDLIAEVRKLERIAGTQADLLKAHGIIRPPNDDEMEWAKRRAELQGLLP